MRCLLHGIVLEGNTNDLNQQMKLKGKLMYGEPLGKVNFKGGFASRVQFASKCFELVLMF